MKVKIPAHSCYVRMQTHCECWHVVQLPHMSWQEFQNTLAWCDRHVMHPWSMQSDVWYFSHVSDAAQFALTFALSHN
jgi:hypothetical protein